MQGKEGESDETEEEVEPAWKPAPDGGFVEHSDHPIGELADDEMDVNNGKK